MELLEPDAGNGTIEFAFEATEAFTTTGAERHEFDDLRRATSSPADWVRALEAEGLLDRDEREGQTLVRLRPQPVSAS